MSTIDFYGKARVATWKAAREPQPHHGTRPRFMAQPPLLPRQPIRLDRGDGDYSPVELAIRQALEQAGG